MNTTAPRQVRELVIGFLSSQNSASETELAKLKDETNLLEHGYLDSFGFIDLLTHMEEQTGISIDFIEADPSELATLIGLQRQYGG